MVEHLVGAADEAGSPRRQPRSTRSQRTLAPLPRTRQPPLRTRGPSRGQGAEKGPRSRPRTRPLRRRTRAASSPTRRRTTSRSATATAPRTARPRRARSPQRAERTGWRDPPRACSVGHMRVLVLGGTQWVGAAVATTAVDRGHDVTALARGTRHRPGRGDLRARRQGYPGAYDAVSGRQWDAVIDVARQPGQVRGAVEALGSHAGHWVFVSSCSVYADHDEPGADESARLLPAHPGDVAAPESYGGEGRLRRTRCRHVAPRAHSSLGRVSSVVPATTRAAPGTGPSASRIRRPRTARCSSGHPHLGTQVIDVRDLAAWLVESAEVRRPGSSTLPGRSCRLRRTSRPPGRWPGTPARW